jgi:hypothetical protein
MSKVINFKNLDELIHSGIKEIVLKSDVVFQDEEDYLDGIKLDDDNLVIDGNNHIIDGSDCAGIFTVSGKNILIKNLIFKNGNVEGYGGAINNLEGSKLRVSNVYFVDNSSFYGGAIFNEGKMEIEDAYFKNNHAKSGGAIANGSWMIIKYSKFDNNTADNAGAIDNWQSLEIKDSIFRQNSAKIAGSMINDGKLNLDSTVFENNSADSTGAIHNQESGVLTIKNSKFKSNSTRNDGIIFNEGDFTILDSTFIDNRIFGESGSILNSQNAKLKVKHVKYANENPLGKDKIEYDSKYVQELIDRGIKEIKLESGIKFLQKINIEVDNVLIDGNDNSIEIGKYGSTGGFSVSGDNVILKNFKLENFRSPSTVVLNRGGLKIINFTFTGFDLAISNFGNLKVINSSFLNNQGDDRGNSIIYNSYSSEVEIINSTFRGNIGKTEYHDKDCISGGPIENSGEMTIKSSKFLNNGGNCACMINNHGIIRITASSFEKSDFIDYLIISFDGELEVRNAVFDCGSWAAIKAYSKYVKLYNCSFTDKYNSWKSTYFIQ